jgi:hypothetical protein
MTLPGAEALRGPEEAALAEIHGGAERALSVSIHDASRLEWNVSIPLPDRHALDYLIEVELEVPTNEAARRAPWEQLQSFTRLSGATAAASSDDSTVDALRRSAVTLTHMLERAREGFARHARAGALVEERSVGGRDFLTIWLDAALRSVQETRKKITGASPADSTLIARERALVDEFVSVRLLEVLSESEGVVRSTMASVVQGDARAALESLSFKVANAVRDEFAYRREKGFLCPDARSPQSLEQYVERAALLKKHFEEVLFLDRESDPIDEYVQQGIAAFTALLAGLAVFAIQVVLAKREEVAKLELGWGLLVLGLVAGFFYAARDRLKEVGRAWLTGKVYRFHAQRLTRCRIPARRRSTRDVVVRAKESCNQTVRTRPDPLNPEAGASLAATLVQYVHRGRVLPQPSLTATGVTTVRHIFRYDLSPLFPRLSDEIQRVPILDEGRVGFAEAPRRYRVHVAVKVKFQREEHEERVTIVLDKGGLRRIEPGFAPEPEPQ